MVPLGPYTFSLRSHEGPSWANLSLYEKSMDGLKSSEGEKSIGFHCFFYNASAISEIFGDTRLITLRVALIKSLVFSRLLDPEWVL